MESSSQQSIELIVNGKEVAPEEVKEKKEEKEQDGPAPKLSLSGAS